MRPLWIGLIGAAALAAASPACGQSPGLAQQLERLAEGGNAEARYHLGMLYNDGIGVPQDPSRAYAHFRAAAEAGDPLGAYKVGCYYAGQFGDEAVAPDEGEALRWKLVAARAGYALAQNDVALHYLRRQLWAEARPWLEAAGRQGEAQALYNLSMLHHDGLGGAPSRPHAWAYFRRDVGPDDRARARRGRAPRRRLRHRPDAADAAGDGRAGARGAGGERGGIAWRATRARQFQCSSSAPSSPRCFGSP